MPTSPTENKQKVSSNTLSLDDIDKSKNYPLVEREPLNNTPFYIVGNKDIGYKLTWGKFTFNDEPLKGHNEVKKWYSENKWQIILHLIAIGIASVENQWKDDFPAPDHDLK